MIFVAYAITILLTLIGILSRLNEKKQHINKRIQSTFQTDSHTTKEIVLTTRDEVKKTTFSKRIISPFLDKLKRAFKRNLTSEQKEKLDMKLIRAGSPFGMTAVEFRMLQLTLLLVLPLLFGGYGLLIQAATNNVMLFAVIGLLLALYLPNNYIKQKTIQRNKAAIKELPDFLDLLTVSIEAGLGFDSALSKVVSKKTGILSKEFQRCLEEIRLGSPRKAALNGVRERLDNDDIKSLIGSIIQAEQLGIGMSKVLNVQSAELRMKRKQRAEEQAMKAPVKMLIPMVLFIFPCIFIVLLGPALIGLLNSL